MLKRGTLVWLIPILLIFVSSIISINVEARQSKTIGGEVMIDLIRYDPSPVQPGEPFDVWFEIRNIYGYELSNIKITMSSPLPFMKIQGEKYTTEFKILGQDNVKSFKYTLITSNEIRDGDYDLSLNYYSDRLGEWITEKYTIKIKKVNFIVSTTTVTVEPEKIPVNKISQGETAKLNIHIQNNADYLMKNVDVMVDLSSSEIPIVTMGSTTEKTIKEIPSGQESKISFDVLALPNADSGVYKIPIKIKYYDELGNNYTKDDLVGLIIGSEPSLHLELRESEIYSIKGTGNVDVNFVNDGLIDIKALKVLIQEPKVELSLFGIKLSELKKYEVLSEDYIYVGDVDVDDSESVSFRLKLKTFDRKITIPFILNYKDVNNNEYTETKYLTFEIHSKKDMGLGNNSYVWYILIILLIIAFFDYRVWKKHNKEQGFLDYISSIPRRILEKFRRKR